MAKNILHPKNANMSLTEPFFKIDVHSFFLTG